MSNMLSKLNYFETLFESCIFHRNYISQSSDEQLGAIYSGDSKIISVTGQAHNKALSLDGTGDFISYADQKIFDIGTEDFSVEFTINTTDTAGVICGKRSGVGNGWIVETAVGLDINFQIDDGTEASGNNTTALSAGWHHIAITADRSGNATFYIDGTADGTLSISGSTGTLTNSIAFQVGIDGDDSTNPLDGEIALVRLWKRTLTSDEVSLLVAIEGFGSGNPFDLNRGLVSYWPLGNIIQGINVLDIKGSNDGTPTSLDESDVVTGYNHQRNGLQFDKVNDFVTIGDLSAESIQAISFWAKADTTTESIIQFKSSTQRSIEVSSGTIGTTGLTSPTIYNNGKETSILQDKTWNHMVVVFSTITDADNFIIGAEGVTAYGGALQDIMIWDRQPTLLEIERLHKSQLEGYKI